jgi:hypothetical protein
MPVIKKIKDPDPLEFINAIKTFPGSKKISDAGKLPGRNLIAKK